MLLIMSVDDVGLAKQTADIHDVRWLGNKNAKRCVLFVLVAREGAGQKARQLRLGSGLLNGPHCPKSC